MIIKINGEKTEINKTMNIKELVNFLKLEKEIIAIEKNKKIVYKQNYEKELVKDNDSIEIIRFFGGG